MKKLTENMLEELNDETLAELIDFRRTSYKHHVEQENKVQATLHGLVLTGLVELQQRRAADKNFFMYGIADPDGNPYFDEFCVSADPDVIQEEVNALGEGYRVVGLYTALPLTDAER